ncbi:PREDICTED: 39S ribosomal protein L33, mitochondrial [Cariama cristata]|nr:PREDICTED: 39S ribosomal protein L33, mitochondrial [Cariama cristata]
MELAAPSRLGLLIPRGGMGLSRKGGFSGGEKMQGRWERPTCAAKKTVAKSKSKYVLVRMKSAAETGYCFNIRRLRLQEKLVLLRYDPIAKQRVLFTEKRKIRSI